MVYRIYADASDSSDCRNVKNNIESSFNRYGIVQRAQLIYAYDIDGITDEEFEKICESDIFQHDGEDLLYELPRYVNRMQSFAVELTPGTFDSCANSAEMEIQLITGGRRPTVHRVTIYAFQFYSWLDEDNMERVKRFVISRLSERETDFSVPETLDQRYEQPRRPAILRYFNSYSDENGDFENFKDYHGLSMSVEDLKFCQKYFRDVAKRDPTITEIRVVDTYWSDHCRHTTFTTAIEDIEFAEGNYKAEFEDAFAEYVADRLKLEAAKKAEAEKKAEEERIAAEKAARRSAAAKKAAATRAANKAKRLEEERIAAEQAEAERLAAEQAEDTAAAEIISENAPESAITLMDIGTLAAKSLKLDGTLTGLDESDEINACSIAVKAEVDGRTEDWLVMFKNETHNHPTEIEPYGGAATCLGGAIRDPLSGRSYVYHAMRVTGAADPRRPYSETLAGKLPQRTIVTEAARGFSSYGNQIGLATGQVREIYHEGYLAKRMEIGAVIGAAPAANVIRGQPVEGDLVLLVGGRTGRDGIGGATGSSKVHTTESIETCGAEVQKGNPITERKIQRLFRNPKASRLIKRCNDFGAGGVSVAIGELADGLEVNLDAVRKKYEGLDGTELAISESQERMAVVLAPADLEAFLKLADEENVEAYVVGKVTGKNKFVLEWRGDKIVELRRDFLSTNGVRQRTKVVVEPVEKYTRVELSDDVKTAWLKNLQKLNVCSQHGLVEMFDSTVGAGTVLMPYGGKNQLTPSEGIAAKLPVDGETKTATAMAFGFDAKISAWSPYHGAIDAVTSSLAKLTAIGADYAKSYLSFQEYFERLGSSPEKWGRPFAALLGAYKAQKRFGVAAIGGKDSMSGTYENLNVPPTLVSFAVAVVDADFVISPEFKSSGNKVYLIECVRDEYNVPKFRELKRKFAAVHQKIGERKIISAMSIGVGGVAEAISKMAIGNDIGFRFSESVRLFEKNYGSLIVEAAAGVELDFMELGETIDAQQIEIGDVTITLDEIKRAWTEPLEKIFPTKIDTLNDTPDETSGAANGARIDNSNGITVDLHKAEVRHKSKVKIARPRVFIPVFPGTNCEYESARGWRFAGAKPNALVVRNLTPEAIEETVTAFVDEIGNSQVIMFPGGFSAGDEPDGSAKFIAAMFRNPRMAEAVKNFLQRDGLILGICNGFQALVRLGLLPHGEIRKPSKDSPMLVQNTIGRHVSRMVRTRVTSNLSPWLAGTAVGDVHTIAVSHGEGRFVASEDWLRKLAAAGQIATQYVDFNDNPTQDFPHNPNGSFCAIEGITSADGRIFGKMGHSERIGDNVCKNVPGNKNQHLFEAGVNYFS